MIKSCLILLLAVIVAAVFIWKAFQETPKPLPFTDAAKREFEIMRRQFQTEADYQKRLMGQQMSEQELKQKITTANAEQQILSARFQDVTEAEARAWYDSNHEQLRIPPTYHAAHLFLTRHGKTKPDREAEIRSIHRQIIAGEISFSVATAKYSEDERTKTINGDLGWFIRERVPIELINTVERLKPGQLSEPILSKLGWHLIKLIELRPSSVPSFDASKAEIMAALETARKL